MWALYILIGVILGVIGTLMFSPKKQEPLASGRFVMDFTDPVKDICRLELDEDLNVIYTKKRIWLNVVTYGEDSQK